MENTKLNSRRDTMPKNKLFEALDEVAVSVDDEPENTEPEGGTEVDNPQPAAPEQGEPEVKEPEAKPQPQPHKASPKRATKADLQAKIDLLQSELNNVVDNSADFTAQLNAKDTEIANQKAQIESLTAALTTIIESKKEGLPDNIKALMPENMDAVATLNWLIKAEGGQSDKAPEKPEVEIGKRIPMNNNNPASAEHLSPYDRMSGAFAQLFKTK